MGQSGNVVIPQTVELKAEKENIERSTRTLWLLISVLFIAAVLRFWGISFGLPHDFTPDEIHEIVRALKLGTGEYTWEAGKGGLYLILFVEYGLLFVFWWLGGVVQSPNDFAVAYLTDPTAFYLLGRSTVALMGVANCFVVYAIGRRIYDSRVGLIAAFIGATTYYHVVWSHYINVDIGMTLALWASVLGYIEYERTQNLRWLFMTGSLAGVAFAFKSPGLVVAIPIGLALVSSFNPFKKPHQFLRRVSILLASALATLIFISPESLLNFGSMITSNFSGLITESKLDTASTETLDEQIFDLTLSTGPAYIAILLREWNIGLTLAALGGAVFGILRVNRWDLILALSVAIYLLGMTVADRPGTERYLLPMVPALWLLAARLISQTSSRVASSMALIALVCAYPLYASVKQNYMWTMPDTRVLAKNWIEANAAPESKILMDGMKYRFISSPPLTPNVDAVSRRIGRAEEEKEALSRGVSTRMLRLYEDAMNSVGGPRFDLHSTIWGLEVERVGYYVDKCFDYIVVSSDISDRFQVPQQVERYPVSAKFYHEVYTHQSLDLVYSVQPVEWRIQGPRIDVFRVNNEC